MGNSTHNHLHDYKAHTLRRLGWSLGITAVVMIVELVGGWISGSIALISDAGHMLTHAFALGISIAGLMIARLPACHHRTFGLLRAEIVVAFVSALFLLAVTVWIVSEAIERLIHPHPIAVSQMLVVAVLGLAVNLISIALLEGKRHGDMNVHSVFLHMVSDAASSVAIVIAAVVIRFTGWVWIDPAISLGIAVLILIWAVTLLRESMRVLIDMAPRDRTVDDIITAMHAEFPQIVGTEHEHVWTITPSIICLSAHLNVDTFQLTLADLSQWLGKVEQWLAERFDVSESMLEIHPVNPPSGLDSESERLE